MLIILPIVDGICCQFGNFFRPRSTYSVIAIQLYALYYGGLILM